MKILEIPENETIEIISANVIEFWRDGQLMGDTHKGLADTLRLTGIKGLTIVMTDRLPNESER
jgi:hypothetical protein